MGGVDKEVENWRDTMRCGGLRTSRLQEANDKTL